MEKSSTESINNFWSHFPKGLTYRELIRMSPEETDSYSQSPAPQSIILPEVVINLVPETVAETSHNSAA